MPHMHKLLLLALGVGLGAGPPQTVHAALPTRSMVAIGGNYEDRSVMARLLAQVGDDAQVVIMPMASSEPEVAAQAYRTYFQALGARHVSVVLAPDLTAANDPQKASMVGRADLLFFTGGNQTLLANLLTGTALGGAVTAAWERGALLAGTSAGAMVWGTEFIANGDSTGALTSGFARSSVGTSRPSAMDRNNASPGLDLAPGLGLFPDLLVDTRFSDQLRLGRLLLGVAAAPSTIGLGIDARTAAIITPATIRVMGPGTVTVLDPRGNRLDNAEHAGPQNPLVLLGFRFDRLFDGLSLPRVPKAPLDASWLAPSPTEGACPMILLSSAQAPLPGDPLLSSLVEDAGGTQASILVLAGEEAYGTAMDWQEALLRTGAAHASVLASNDLSDAGLTLALQGVSGVLLIEDQQGDLLGELTSPEGHMAQILARKAHRVPLGATGTALRILGSVAVFARPARSGYLSVKGLDLLPGTIWDAELPATDAFDRLLWGQSDLPHGVGIGMLPASDAQVARGQVVVTRGDALVLQTGPDSRFIHGPHAGLPMAATGLVASLLPRAARFDLMQDLPHD